MGADHISYQSDHIAALRSYHVCAPFARALASCRIKGLLATSVWVTATPMRIHSSFIPSPRQSIVPAAAIGGAGLSIKLARRVAQIPPIQRYLISRKSSMPYRDPSRPIPDSFIPPNGATAVEIRPVLMPTIPYSRASDTRQTRPTSRL